MHENPRATAGKRAIRDSRLVPTSALMTYRFVLPLLLTALCEQIVTSLMRITTSYRAVELGLSVVWLGIITAFFAVLPMLTAVKIGRFIDRGHDARTAWIGGGVLVVACAGLSPQQTPVAALLWSTPLRSAHLMLVIRPPG